MCQLTAYIGDRPIAPLLLKALELQEPYLGAHATGMAVINNGKLSVEKGTGHVSKVKKTTKISKLTGTTGIGHSRYSALARDDPRFDIDAMAHPFTNDDNSIALMHNGDIKNFKDHWAQLKSNHKFKSYNQSIDWITDSEVAVHLLSDLVKRGKGVGEALKEIFPSLVGDVLLCVINDKEPETIYIANRYQPCYLGVGKNEVMWCSSNIGFELIKDELQKIYKAPKNSLMKLTRGKVETEVLDPNYNVPDLKLNKKILKEAILELLSIAPMDFRNLRQALNHKGGVGRAYGIEPDTMLAYMKNGVSIVNPYIETLDELIEEGKIIQKIDRRLEGCTPNTPRFVYNII